MFSTGYKKSGLGRRIALTLVRALGRKTLGLGYAAALTDLALAPGTPSNTARCGGTIFPIISNIPAVYGSAPGPTARKLGGYIMWEFVRRHRRHEFHVPDIARAECGGSRHRQEDRRH